MKVNPELISSFKELPSNKKLYFASDFHLGIPDEDSSRAREMKIIKWLEYISNDASAIFLVGDIFDFWFEYRTTIPKGFVRFQGKLAELSDKGIPIYLFTGNHDLWMKDYFPSQLGVEVYQNPIILEVNGKRLFVGHGDGLGSGDGFYKIVKKVFTNRFCNWLFQWMHPNIGVSIAQYWSRRSRLATGILDEEFQEEKERLWQFAEEMNKSTHHDYYIFGHRHLPLELPVADHSTYFNLGEWVNHCTYLEFDGDQAILKVFEG
ncbi:UDP-2,3-diacylglucosamine diphosphatase [Ekhidna sp. To15]|uniref:UDP-2,3-diacylglucosamine diphosphatase n=1 Tax=Ekhidna sp. To15 TaxID=3395267 RepID=UPI003F5271BD